MPNISSSEGPQVMKKLSWVNPLPDHPIVSCWTVLPVLALTERTVTFRISSHSELKQIDVPKTFPITMTEYCGQSSKDLRTGAGCSGMRSANSSNIVPQISLFHWVIPQQRFLRHVVGLVSIVGPPISPQALAYLGVKCWHRTIQLLASRDKR